MLGTLLESLDWIPAEMFKFFRRTRLQNNDSNFKSLTYFFTRKFLSLKA